LERPGRLHPTVQASFSSSIFKHLGAFRAPLWQPTCFLLVRKAGMTQQKEDDMKLTYDIFRKFAQDGPVWIETVQGIEKCKSRMLDLVQRNPGEYFVFDPVHSRVVAISSTTQPL
jgi:hypothetical protein